MTSEIKDIFSKQTLQYSDIELKEQKKEIFKGKTTGHINQYNPDLHELESKSLDNKSKKIDICLRISFAFWVLVIVTSFLLFVREILYLKFNYDKNLSDNVIIALLTTTTINVLTLAFMVIRYLFPKKLKKKISSNKILKK